METKDWIELAVLLITGGGILWQLASAMTKFKEIGKQQATEITTMKDEMKIFRDETQEQLVEVNKVLVKLATQDGRLNLMEDRQAAQGRRLDAEVQRLSRFLDSLPRNLSVFFPRESNAD